MKVYSIGQMQDMYATLQYSVKHGGFDEDYAEKLINDQDWDEIKRLIDMADAMANDNEYAN